MRPALRRVSSEAAGKAVTPAAAPVTFPFTQSCFSLQPQTFVYSPALPASVPVASYFGSVYGTQSQPCGLSPEYVAGHYAKGGGGNHYGSGQTMVVTAAYGYPFTVRDANFLEEGASALTAKNYREAAPFGRPADPLAGTKLGWDHQIAQAVQWAHGFAGESNLVLLLAKDDKPASFLALENYIVTHHLGHVVSNTWSGGPERSFSGADLAAWNRVLQLGAAQGIDFLFPSGDDGDNGVGSALGAPNFPASSPYVTAVGGTSLIKRPDGNYNEVGWGTYRTDVAAGGPLAAPVQRGFQGGSGGGESAVFPKPAWQAGLLGTGRQVPDIAAFADPYMGAVYTLTVNGQYTLQVTGGTGVAVSILTGLLTQADDAADHPLGQAAPRIARMNTAGMQDLTAVSGPANVQGAVFTDGNQVVYPARALFSNAPEFPLSFWSAIWPYANGSASVLSFGTDTSLQVGPGWDNVTGWGVPAAGFVEEVSK
ncbi:MAG: hypothetical protein INR62_01720 [Rhodospirillales bacterium]|nr:hypothetical protein [Acetobacter sp.]